MTALERAAADYLRIRRALGFKLERTEKLLAQYFAYLERRGEERVTVENTLAWATLPAARKRQLVGVPALGGARVRNLLARARSIGTRSRRPTCSPAGSGARSHISIPIRRSRR